MLETLEIHPDCAVDDAEYRRLLGFPRDHVPGDRALELSDAARRWYAKHGRPWIYARQVSLEVSADGLRIDGMTFHSKPLRDLIARTGARRAALVAVSAGAACEEQARRLWEAGKPDEYFFLEVFGSAVVERLMAAASGHVCAVAEPAGLVAVPHYSPGYSGWDVADQVRLFELMARGRTRPWPGPLDVLPSGMLRPKKSLLGVFGLAARSEATRAAMLEPCTTCPFSPCQYRRAPYRPGPASVEGTPMSGAVPVDVEAAAPRRPRYSVNERALEKWARERIALVRRSDGSTAARFRFDGTTCSNLGRPLAFDYHVELGPAALGSPILAASCRPAAGDDGYAQMCAYLSDGPALLRTIAAEGPLLGRPLGDVFAWMRPAAPSGCYCLADSRLHKWGLALEAIHFALTAPGRPPAVREPASALP